jgi:transcriptional regulator with XRE-family HTH domain
MKMTNYFIDRINEKKSELNLSTTDLSSITKINRVSMHNILNRKSEPTFETIYNIAQAVNLKIILIDTSIKTKLPIDNLEKYIKYESDRLNLLSELHGTLNNFLSAFNEAEIHKKKESLGNHK